MKQYKCLFAALLFAAGSYASVSAHAETTINIPYEAGRPEVPENCVGGDFGTGAWLRKPSAAGSEYCNVDFPITLPTGSTVKQIVLLHNGFPVLAGYNIITAYLGAQSIASPVVLPTQFFWASSALIGYTVVHTNLMQQSGGTYPDAFVMLPDRVYHVIVHVSGPSAVNGLQVIYDP